MSLENAVISELERARRAARSLALASSSDKERLLAAIVQCLSQSTDHILAANQTDLKKARDSGMSGALVERLSLSPERIAAMGRGVEEVMSLPDPVGEIIAR